MSTLWQAIRNLIQFRNHVFKAENIPLPEATPAESAPSPTSPLTCPYEYILATCHLAKAMLFSYAALEATTAAALWLSDLTDCETAWKKMRAEREAALEGKAKPGKLLKAKAKVVAK